MAHTAHYDSLFGGITLASDGSELIGLWWNTQRYFGSTLGGTQTLCRSDDAIDAARCWLDVYFSGAIPDFTPPLRLVGTPFQQRVWRELLSIPYGEVLSYGAIAKRIGTSARAVGGAVGRNPISLIVPCHRVIGSDAAMTGYTGGIDLKRQLLSLEAHSALAVAW